MHSHSEDPALTTVLQLLGSWDLRTGELRCDLRGRERRLVALVALSGVRPRAHLAGTLWPESDENRAATNLRSAVWHVRQASPNLLSLERGAIALGPGVQTDVQQFLDCIRAAMDDPSSFQHELALQQVAVPDLLPGWYDDWVLFHRERIRHLSVRALERLAAFHLDHGDPELAAASATGAIALEPLRETPYQLVVRAHIASGNRSYAWMAFQDYSNRLEDDLGIEPSQEMCELAARIPRQRRPHQR